MCGTILIQDRGNQENSHTAAKPRPMEKHFKRELRSLHEIFHFLQSFITFHSVNKSTAFTIKFAVEELFTNMVKYNKSGAHDILISANLEGESVVVQLVDFETEPFDITKAAEANVELPLEQREPGGLGLHLINKMVDKINYQHVDDKSTITLMMRLGK
jgi:anti-sigma regulatory factor (Ser/Thr protein kinase)